jgi:hypothetical protein
MKNSPAKIVVAAEGTRSYYQFQFATPVPMARAFFTSDNKFRPYAFTRAGIFFWRTEMTTRLLAPLAFTLLGTMLAQSGGSQPEFQGKGVTRVGHLQFDAGVEIVFPLFTPLGEKHWAKGWDPEIVYPRDRDVAEGMVFRTQNGVEHVWTVIHYDPANRAVAYNVVAYGMMVRAIEVRCRPAGTARTVVEVTDSYVGLSPQGNAFIEHLTEDVYEKKMAGWKESIGGYLAGAAKPAH